MDNTYKFLHTQITTGWQTIYMIFQLDQLSWNLHQPKVIQDFW